MPPWTAELCCDVRPTALDWFWLRYLARGKLAILDGDPGMGKSLLTLDLIARPRTKLYREEAIRRGQGSMGIVAAVRTALFAAPHPANPDARVLTVAKTNVGRRPAALGYELVESAGQPVVRWTGPVDLTAD